MNTCERCGWPISGDRGHHPGCDDTYTIRRRYADENRSAEVIRTGVTLAEAQRHCQDPETSSRTATSSEAAARTRQFGEWFDGYDREVSDAADR